MKSIRQKIIFSMGITTMVFLLLLGSISSVMNYRNSFAQLKSDMSITAQMTAKYVEQQLNVYRTAAETFGMRNNIADPNTPKEEKERFMNIWVQKYDMERGNILNSSGISILNGKNYSDRDYFNLAMSGKTVVSTPVISKDTNKPTFVVAAPLWKDGDTSKAPIGCVYFVPKENFLNDIMSNIHISKSSAAYVIDKNGFTIADIDSSKVCVENIEQEAASNKELDALAEIHAKMRAGEIGVGNYKINGDKKISAYAPLENTDNWSLAICAKTNDFMASTVISIVTIITIAIISIVVSIIIAGIVSKKIASPISQCADRMLLLSKGDLHTPMPDIDAKDETGVLVNASKDLVAGLSASIEDIRRVLGEMARGNFDVDTVDEYYPDDFAGIRTSLYDINNRLSSTLSQIHIAAEQVASGSDQVSCGAQALSQGATEQASSVEELAATISKITEDIQVNAKNAEESNHAAQTAGTMLVEANQKMQDLIAAMNEINTSSSEISRIIKTIEDIAFQTNILALNAAVEAARAGSAGKGFAVVADEVRNLAAKSAEASKSTAALIERSIHAVDNGMQIVNNTASSLEQTADSAKTAVSGMSAITENSKIQAEAAQQISVGVDQIASVVQTNSATAQESAAASEELSSQAELLKELVSGFTLRDGQSSGMGFSDPMNAFSQPSMQAQPSNKSVELYSADQVDNDMDLQMYAQYGNGSGMSSDKY